MGLVVGTASNLQPLGYIPRFGSRPNLVVEFSGYAGAAMVEAIDLRGS